jgi:hypothetical protein
VELQDGGSDTCDIYAQIEILCILLPSLAPSLWCMCPKYEACYFWFGFVAMANDAANGFSDFDLIINLTDHATNGLYESVCKLWPC